MLEVRTTQAVNLHSWHKNKLMVGAFACACV
jgi:hypothetical protein